ncbi:MAG: adenylate/guanylate cyclase domain-containing protein, partial [Burkholderiaceae bacterium]
HAGTVDKFIGDAVMAVFNAPIPQSDHVARAVRCALELDLFCESFREKMNAEGIPIGVTRIGIHTGVATVGNFGSHARMDFTALGDTVNTASRTEGVNKYFGTRICATQEVVSQCPDLFFLPIGDIVLKGKTQAVRLFTPVSEEKSRSAFALRYEEAVHALENLGSSGNQYESDDATQVAGIVQKLNEDIPEEPLAAFHAKRVSQGIVSLRVVMEDK